MVEKYVKYKQIGKIMGFGKSLKKFVKKAAPIIGAVAPFFLPPGMGAAVGAIAGGMGGETGNIFTVEDPLNPGFTKRGKPITK